MKKILSLLLLILVMVSCTRVEYRDKIVVETEEITVEVPVEVPLEANVSVVSFYFNPDEKNGTSMEHRKFGLSIGDLKLTVKAGERGGTVNSAEAEMDDEITVLLPMYIFDDLLPYYILVYGDVDTTAKITIYNIDNEPISEVYDTGIDYYDYVDTVLDYSRNCKVSIVNL